MSTELLVNARHGRFVVDSRDEFVARKLINTGEYGAEELSLLAGQITPESDVLIVGAHIGSFVVPLSRECKSLVAVEANPHTYAMLERNVIGNGCGNVELHYGAASEVGGETIDFLCGTHNSGGSKRKPLVARPDYYYDAPEQVTVPTLRLDDICAGRKFDLVHMDIEGSEMFALRGAQTLLPSVKYLSVEFISHHLTDVAGVTVDEWLEPIWPHFNKLLIPGSKDCKRPYLFFDKGDWREILQGIVDSGGGHEGIVFWNAP